MNIEEQQTVEELLKESLLSFKMSEKLPSSITNALRQHDWLQLFIYLFIYRYIRSMSVCMYLFIYLYACGLQNRNVHCLLPMCLILHLSLNILSRTADQPLIYAQTIKLVKSFSQVSKTFDDTM